MPMSMKSLLKVPRAPRVLVLALVGTLAANGFSSSSVAQTKPTTTAKPFVKPTPSASASAGAEPPDLIEGSDELQRLYLEGDAALKRGDFTMAENLLTKAWALSKSFDVAGKLGDAKLNLLKYREAGQYLSFAVRNALPSTRPKRREIIKNLLDEAKKKLATVKVSMSVVEAKLLIDGAALDPLFMGPEIYVDPGKHVFEATAEGYAAEKSEVDAKAGEILVVTLTLQRGAPKGVPTTPPPPPTTPWPAAVMGGAGGLAIIAGAVLIGAAESKKTEAYDVARNTLTADGNPTCPRTGPGPNERCDQVRAAAADADVFGNVGIGVFVGAGVLIAGATAYMLFLKPETPPVAEPPKAAVAKDAKDSKDSKSAEARSASQRKARARETGRSVLVPVVGPHAGGLVWQGSF